jgi:hypothetical protein
VNPFENSKDLSLGFFPGFLSMIGVRILHPYPANFATAPANFAPLVANLAVVLGRLGS